MKDIDKFVKQAEEQSGPSIDQVLNHTSFERVR